MIPPVTIRKTNARMTPIVKINLAWMSSGVSLLWLLGWRNASDVSNQVLRALSCDATFRRLAFFGRPPFKFLTWVSDPSVVSTARKNQTERENYALRPNAVSAGFSHRRITGAIAERPAPRIAFGSVIPARYTASDAAKKLRNQLAARALT